MQKSFEKASHTKCLKEWFERSWCQARTKTNQWEQEKKTKHHHSTLLLQGSLALVTFIHAFTMPEFILFMLILLRAWFPSVRTINRQDGSLLLLLECSPLPTSGVTSISLDPIHSTHQILPSWVATWWACHSPALQGRHSTDWAHTTWSKTPCYFHSLMQQPLWRFSFLQRKLASNYFRIWTYLGLCQGKGKLAGKVCNSSFSASVAHEPAFFLTGSSLD